jgi:hypothetical protein
MELSLCIRQVRYVWTALWVFSQYTALPQCSEMWSTICPDAMGWVEDSDEEFTNKDGTRR